jgi:hypothetical protein
MPLTPIDWKRADEALLLLESSTHDSLSPISAGRMVADYDRMTEGERLSMYDALNRLIDGEQNPGFPS